MPPINYGHETEIRLKVEVWLALAYQQSCD